MNISDQLQVLSQVINFILFIYFATILIQTNPLDLLNLIISTISMLISLIISIISAIEKSKENQSQ